MQPSIRISIALTFLVFVCHSWRPCADAPTAPNGLKAIAGNAQVTLSWTDSSDATTYNVYRGTAAGGESATPTGTTAKTNYTDTALTSGMAYYYKVAGVNSAATSSLPDGSGTGDAVLRRGSSRAHCS
ncbi:MAG: fibronectin type III domain-containing protein [Capsulimonadaceae bacterium]